MGLTLNDFLNKKYPKKQIWIIPQTIQSPKDSIWIQKTSPRILHKIRTKIDRSAICETIGFYGLSADLNTKRYIFQRKTDIVLNFRFTYPTNSVESSGNFLELLIEFIQVWVQSQRGYPYLNAQTSLRRDSTWFNQREFAKIKRDLLHYKKGITTYYVKDFVSMENSIIQFLEYGKRMGVFRDTIKLIQCPRCGILVFKQCRFCEVA